MQLRCHCCLHFHGDTAQQYCCACLWRSLTSRGYVLLFGGGCVWRQRGSAVAPACFYRSAGMGWGDLERCWHACVRVCSSWCLCWLLVYTYRRAEKGHAEACVAVGVWHQHVALSQRQHVWSDTCVRFASMRHTALSVVQYMLSIASAFTAL